MLERLLLALALAAPLGALQDAPPARLVIGSKNFPESRLLGEMLRLLALEHTDLEVEHRASLGGTLVCFTALQSGEIDLYPEYTGTGWSVVLEHDERIADPMRTYFQVAAEYRARWDVEWLSPFGLNNTYVVAVAEDRAAALDLSTLSDLAARGAELRAGFSIEFSERPDGWKALAEEYGMHLREVRSLEHGLAYEAIASGAVEVVDAYATDGKLLRYPLRLLRDDRGFFPPYHAAPIVRGAVLRAHPELRAALDHLAFRIDDATMMRLNAAVEIDHRGFTEVAREFLEGAGLLADDPGHSSGRDPEELRGAGFWTFFAARWRETLRLLLEHVWLTAVAVLLAALVSVPLGVWCHGHPVAERLTLGAAGVVQTIPSLALLAFTITVPWLGLSVRSAIAALFLYAVLPILRNTHAGLRATDPDLVDAARAIGLTPRQVLLRVRLPLATGTILAGLRTSTVVSVGVATLAAFLGAGGLGEPIVTGLYLNDPDLILAGALPAAALALGADALLGLVERGLVPRGLRARAGS